MFETLEVGRKIKGKEFDEAELKLRQQLLGLQFELEGKPWPVIVIVSGVEAAGKGSVVHRLNEWMDPRGIDTFAFWDNSDEEESRPFYWRFWRAMPAHGKIGVFFGSWYTRPIIERVYERISDAELDAEMQRVAEFERMLSDDGALVIKLWFHLSEKAVKERLDKEAKERLKSLNIPEENVKYTRRYKDFTVVSERALRQTDSSYSPWHLIEAENANYRDLTAGEVILAALREHLEKHNGKQAGHEPLESLVPDQPTILDTVDTEAALEPEDYKKQLKKYQSRLAELTWQARKEGISCVAVFEGWDAAGKGSAIRRVTQAVDPRLFHLVQFAAPTDEERAHHYLWRFWRQLARDGKHTFFDRSWYGRVLVERVEGFARYDEWQRAYHEINRYEEQIASHGSVVLKFWIHIDKDEQLARFKAREVTPHKAHKITDEDWRNREKWHDYEVAVHDMVTHTSTAYAPWTLVAGNDKRYARIQILKTFCDRLETALKEQPA
jgi:polyphosphate:AMP phosphotransferase